MLVHNLFATLVSMNLESIKDVDVGPSFKKEILNQVQMNINITLCNANKNIFVFSGADHDDFYNITLELYKNKDSIILPCLSAGPTGPTLFTTPGEGWSNNNMFRTIHMLIEIFGLTKNINFTDCSLNSKQMYERFCLTENIDPRLNCFFFKNNFNSPNLKLNNTLQYLHFDYNELPLNDKKLYGCFNIRPRIHRQGLVALLHYYDLLEDGHVSSPGDWFAESNGYDKDTDWKKFIYGAEEQLHKLKFYNDLKEKIVELNRIYPLRIDNRVDFKNVNAACQSRTLYNCRMDSLIEVIPETLFDGPHFFSEKTFAPISLTKPFIMTNSANSLESLKLLGYKTFHPFIDETYDSIVDGGKRLNYIVRELKRLQQLRLSDPTEFYKIYNSMLEIAKYNKEKFSKNIT